MTAHDPSRPRRASYFSRFAGFRHDPTSTLLKDFNRLAGQQGWAKDSKGYRRQKQECFGVEFDRYFGDCETSLSSWQVLCMDIGLEPGSSITQCKKALGTTAVNIVDLIDRRRIGKAVRVFQNKAQLAEYSRSTGKIVGKERVKNSGIVKALLVNVFPRTRQ